MNRLIAFSLLTFVAFTFASEPVSHEEDSELIESPKDSTQNVTVLLPDTKRKKKIKIQAGGSIDAIWLKYNNPMTDWQLHPWVGYSLSGILVFNPIEPFSIETGIRIGRIGNRTNGKTDPKNTVIRLPIIDTLLFDSSKTVYSKFQMNIYNASLPLKFLLNVKKSPISILTGIDMGYILYADGWINYVDNNLQDSKENDTKVLNRLNFNWIWGMKYQLDRIAFRIEGYWGITNLAKKDEWISEFYSRDISFSIHYIF